MATVDGSRASLSDPRITREWSIGSTSATTVLRRGEDGTNWSNGASPDFSLTLGGVPTSSTTGWTLRSVVARPDPGRGVQLVFSYALDPAGLVTLTRTYTLRPGAAVIGVSSVLHNGSPAPLRVGTYSLDELTSRAHASAQVITYHGGSDWRDDYRVESTETGAFNDEGQVARFDAGRGEGWFFVAERRSGSMARVGRGPDGRSFAGVDNARDLLDAGPILTDPPNYNRVDNPLYPAPVRNRTVPPLTDLRLGRAYTGVYNGGETGAAAAFVTDFAADEMPPFDRSVGLNTFHPWGHGPGMSDANLRAQVDIAGQLGIESFMLDDQWQGGPGGESGDWNWDPARFPDPHGFVDYLHAHGLQLGLWMSPLEFNMASQTAKQHPDWICTPTGDATAQVPDDAGLGVWDVTNPGFQDYLTSVIERLVTAYDVREFKFDFMAWADCPPHDYLDYEDAFVALVHRFEAAHPGVTFELDETNDQRSWPFESAALGPSWFDNAHGHGVGTEQSKLLHDIWSAAPWLPPSSIGFGAYDNTLGVHDGVDYTVDYLFPMAMLSHITFWTDLSQISDADRAETAWWIAWYKAHRADLAGLVYENTAHDPLDGTGWAAFQPWHAGHGYLFAFRQDDGDATQAIRLSGLRSATSYVVTNVRSGQSLGTFTGSALMRDGLAVTLAAPHSAAVLSIDPA